MERLKIVKNLLFYPPDVPTEQKRKARLIFIVPEEHLVGRKDISIIFESVPSERLVIFYDSLKCTTLISYPNLIFS